MRRQLLCTFGSCSLLLRRGRDIEQGFLADAALEDLDQVVDAVGHLGAFVQDAGQPAHRPIDEGLELAGQPGVEVYDQHFDQRGADILHAHGQLLPRQMQGRAQAHARCARCRQRHHADQVDAQADPGQELDFLLGDELLDDPDNVHDGIDQCHDVADHRQAAGHGAEALERDVIVADLAQPFVEGGGGRADVLLVDRVEWSDGDFRRAFGVLLRGFGHETIGWCFFNRR
ncbi:hypothetical protein [Pseudoduganella armeniaca]|uniref:Uncharacterized protein n=1 Tax=Pseudoduganella armeniaca TaxID=2072590 RepID=A0A2R4C9I4_9BURK|nr:hypothetical protein [Pseudoduganella armeniaca]AVR96251.1 hypothetical protein C9I28_11435 [Pseudoduganella armeniaca]